MQMIAYHKNNYLRPVRLRDERSNAPDVLEEHVARRHNNHPGRIFVEKSLGKLKAINFTGKAHVGEDEINFLARRYHLLCFICTASFDDDEALLAKVVSDHHADEDFIFYYQYCGLTLQLGSNGW